MNKVFIELFRFDKNSDYLAYYKKYTIKYDADDKVIDLLNKIKEIENFEFDDSLSCKLKINNYYLNSEELLSDVVARLGNDLTIEPISTFRATKDLVIDKSDFLDKIHLFDNYLSKEEKVDYFEKFQLDYYASNTLNFNKEYIGDHALYIAYDIIRKTPELKDEILDIISDKTNGIWYHTSLKNRLFDFDQSKEEIINSLFEMLPEYNKMTSASISEQKESINIKQSFKGFNIASFEGVQGTDLEPIISKSNANFINISSKKEDIALHCMDTNKGFSLKVAGNILLEAKDNDADFIIVDDENHFTVFDNMQKQIEKNVGREINLPIIKNSQFITLLEGEKDSKKLGFDKHKVQVNFL